MRQLNWENVKRGLSLLKTVNFNSDYRKGPVMLEICTTSACTHRCYFCAEHSSLITSKSHTPLKMEEKMLWSLLEEIKILQVEEVLLGGNGEPTMDTRFKDVVKFLNDAKVKVKVITNGSLLHRLPDETFNQLHKITISINSIEEDTHKIVHGYKSQTQLPITLKSLRYLTLLPNVKDKIQINYVMTSDNWQEFPSLLKFIEEYDLSTAIRPVFIEYDEISHKKITAEVIKQVLAQTERYIQQKSLTKNMQKTLSYLRQSFTSEVFTYQKRNKLLPCFTGFYGGYIESNGDYRISVHCGSKPFANIRNGGFIGIWKSHQLQSKLYSSCIMHETGKPSFANCANCLGVEAYSQQFYKVFSKIPLQMQRLRQHQKNQ